MIRTDRSHLYLAAQTHPGMSGKNNEDNFAVSAYIISAANPTPVVCAVVSDGIGGHKAGEVASELAVNIISAAVEKRASGIPELVLQDGFSQANNAIYRKSEEESRYKGMGATASCTWIIGQQLYIAYVGDSRIYLIRGKKIQQISKDHTWVQEALEKGIIDHEGIKNHPNLHVIRRYLGGEKPPEADLRLFLHAGENNEKARNNQGLFLAQGDIVMMCTDGLSDLLKDNEILSLIQGRTLQKAAQEMISLACERGGHDNITIVMLGVPWSAEKSSPGWVQG